MEHETAYFLLTAQQLPESLLSQLTCNFREVSKFFFERSYTCLQRLLYEITVRFESRVRLRSTTNRAPNSTSQDEQRSHFVAAATVRINRSATEPIRRSTSSP